MARRRVGDSPGGSTTTGSRSSLSDTNDDARESSHPSVARAVERAATSLAVHPDAAYETFRASVLKSSLKLRSARARGGGTEAVGASDEASQTASSSGDEMDKKRESFLAPLRARLANTAAFELQIPSPVNALDERTATNEHENKDASAEPRSVANAPRSEEDDARYHARDGVLSRLPDSVETCSEVETTSPVAPRDVEAPDERSRQSRSRPCSPPPPRRRSFESAARARSADSQKKSGGGDRRRRRERPRVSLDAPTSAALGDDVFGATASPSPGFSGSTPSSAPRRRSASRLFVARETTRRETRASPGSVSRDISATGGGSRGASARPRLAIRDGDLGKIETSLFDDGERRAFFETERLGDVNVNAASADAENEPLIAVSESPRVRDIVRLLSLDSETPRTPETLLARVEALDAERDALRKSVEKLTRKKRRKHSREDRVEDRVSSDAALPRTVVANERRDTNDASVGSSAYVDETRTKTTEDGRSTIATKEDENERVGASRRGILISALTRLFGVSAFVAMAAALLLAAVDIFDIVDPAAPIGATEHSLGRLTGMGRDPNVDRLDRYWERDTGPTGRAARSMLKLPKEMFVRFVADAKNALTSPWLSGHEEARENEGAFEYDDYPVPAPS
jgi:hypothetical protein